MSNLKPIPISALPESIKPAAVRSDRDTSGTLNAIEEINQTAIRAKIDNPEKIKEYNEFVSLAKQYGYDLGKFPVEDYVAIFNEKEKGITKGITERDLPFVKASVLLNKRDKPTSFFSSFSKAHLMGRERVIIEIKPRSVGIVTNWLFSSDSGETRAYIYLDYRPGPFKSDISELKGEFRYTGGGPCDVKYEVYQPKDGAHYNVGETRIMIKILERAIESLKNDPNEAQLIQDLKTTKSFLENPLK